MNNMIGEQVIGLLFDISNFNMKPKNVLLAHNFNTATNTNEFNGISSTIKNNYYHLERKTLIEQSYLEINNIFKKETSMSIDLEWRLFTVLLRNPLRYSEDKSYFSFI